MEGHYSIRLAGNIYRRTSLVQSAHRAQVLGKEKNRPHTSHGLWHIKDNKRHLFPGLVLFVELWLMGVDFSPLSISQKWHKIGPHAKIWSTISPRGGQRWLESGIWTLDGLLRKYMVQSPNRLPLFRVQDVLYVRNISSQLFNLHASKGYLIRRYVAHF